MVDVLLFVLGTLLSITVSLIWGLRFRRDGLDSVLVAAIVFWMALVVISQLVLSAFGWLKPWAVHGMVGGVSALLLGWMAGRRRWLRWLVIGLYLAGARSLQRQLGTQEADLWVAALLMAGLSWGLGPLTSAAERWMMGIALGLGAACKYTGLFLVSIVLVISFFAGGRRTLGIARLISLSGILALILLIASPPYLRNWVITGNPWYPGQISLFGWVLFPDSVHGVSFGSDQATISLWPFLRSSAEARLLYLRAVRHYLGLVPLIGLALSPIALLRRRMRSPLLVVLVGAGLMIVLTWIFPAFPRKEAGGIPDWLQHGYSMVRYAFAPFSLLVISLGVVLESLVSRRSAVGTASSYPTGAGSLPESAARGGLSRGSFVAAGAVGLTVAGLALVVALSPRLIEKRQATRVMRMQELSGQSEDITADWKELNRELSHRDVVVEGLYPWYLAGDDFSNFLRIPDASFVPLAQMQMGELPRVYVYLEKENTQPRHLGTLRELGIPPGQPSTWRRGRFQVWEFRTVKGAGSAGGSTGQRRSTP